MNRFVRLVTLLAIALAASIGSSASALGQDDGGRGDLRFVVVSHGHASDPFWSVVQNGVNQAAEDMGVQVEYQAPDTFDMVEMSQLIDAAVASQPDGLVVSIPDADALGDSIKAAVAAGIPVISMNSGSDVAAEFGLLTHVGQTEYEAGLGAGQRMGETGVTNAICVNQEVGNAALEALRSGDQLGTIQLATFDLSPDVLEAIAAGDMLFAIDQQQYLQGYLPIVLLTLNATNLNTIANPVLMTGPGFVTQENAERIIELSAAGTR